MASSSIWQWISALASRVASKRSLTENEDLKVEKRAAERQIADLKERLEIGHEAMAKNTGNVAAVEKRKQERQEVESLITALKQRLKKEQDDKAALSQTLADMEDLRAADAAEIAKLKKRFNKRKVAAEIASLEKEVADLKKQLAVLQTQKKVYDKNQLLALQIQLNLSNKMAK